MRIRTPRPLVGINRAAASLPPWANLGVGILMILTLAVLDYVTGSQLSFSIFYLAPVLYVTWWAGAWYGDVSALISAVTWGIVDVAAGAHYSSALIPAWNSAMRLGFYIITLHLLDAMRQAQVDLGSMAHTDSLTGLANNRAFYADLEREIERQRRYSRPFAVAYIDLDRFKSVNDRFGHAAGDELLRLIAGGLIRSVRDTDTVARIGGDEFALLLPETDAEMAAAVLERVRLAIDGAVNVIIDDVPGVGGSVGVVVFAEPPTSADEAVALADEAMYGSKQGGRGRGKLVVYGAEARRAMRTGAPAGL